MVLVTSIVACCRHRQEVVLPIAITLLAALSPLSAIGLIPLAACSYFSLLRKNSTSGGNFVRLYHHWWIDWLFPLSMAFLLSIYFGRADNPDNVITLTFAAWGWKRTALAYVHIIVSWFLLVYPVWRVERSFFFRICAVCMLFGPSFFIGCLPGNEETDFNPDHNVLWFNIIPRYMLILAWYWWKDWTRITCWKWLLFSLLACSFGAARVLCPVRHICPSRYLEVDDRWNGHLNHNAPFLKQSIPSCKEPMLPGILLRTAGESEKHFPGCLIPEAPGCDYMTSCDKRGFNWQFPEP